MKLVYFPGILLALASCSLCERSITYEYDAQCPLTLNCSKHGTAHQDEFNNLLYWKAVGRDDTIHYLFSTIGYPAVLQIRTTKYAELRIDWPALFSRSGRAFDVTNGSSLNVFGFGLPRLWRFNDHFDTANIDAASPPSSTQAVHMTNFSWASPLSLDSRQLSTDVTATYYNDEESVLEKNGTVLLSVEVFGETGRANKIPHMPHTENMAQISILLDRLYTNSTSFPQPRFAVEVLAIEANHSKNNAQSDAALDFVEVSSIDDEYTPGVFRTYNLRFPSDSFLAFKPVCYRDAERSLASYTLITHGKLSPESGLSSQDFSILNAFFDEHVLVSTARAFNVTLGYPKDKFYSNMQYALWTVTFGTGVIPTESFSGLIIVLIIVCFGLPGVAILFGSGYLLLKRSRRTEEESLVKNEQLVVNSNE